MFSKGYLRTKAIFQIFLVVFLTFSIGFYNATPVKAQQDVCCAETVSGDHCVYTDASNCSPDSLKAATTCEQTSFCKLGCGFDQNDGVCFNNMPKFSCDEQEGCSWSDSQYCEIPQCQKGCCVLSNQCSFTTQLQCKEVTSQFEGINMTFDENVGSELECINQCKSFDMGACVSEDGSCEFTTLESCNEENKNDGSLPDVGFHENVLCSNPNLGTECAAQHSTSCLPDKDEVYWIDSCGNPENVYSSDKVTSFNNGVVLNKEESCNPGSNNAGSVSCGNCNYAAGSLCAKAEIGTNPVYGDYACKSLSCDVNIVTVENTAPATRNLPFDNGESWCAYDGLVGVDSNAGLGLDLAGSRHYRRVCVNGVELTEPCKDYREELCAQGQIDTTKEPFRQIFYGTQESFALAGGNGIIIAGACRENRWESCTKQDEREDCENTAKRDCLWLLEDDEEPIGFEGVSCVPLVPPGLAIGKGNSGEQTSSADPKSVCEKGTSKCDVVFHRGGVEGIYSADEEGWECVSGCECLEEDYLNGVNSVCRSLGDCGAWYNIAGEYTCDGIEYNAEEVNEDFGQGNEDLSMCNIKPLSFAELKGFIQLDYEEPSGWDEFWSRSWIPVTIITSYGIIGSLVYGYGFFASVFSGFTVTGAILGGTVAGIGGAIQSGATFSNAFATTYNSIYTSGIGTATKSLGVGAIVPSGYSVPAGTTLSQPIAGGSMFNLPSEATNVLFKDATTGVSTSIPSQSTMIASSGEITYTTGVAGVAPEGAKIAGEAAVEATATDLVGNLLGNIIPIINIIMWIWTIYNILDIVLEDTEEVEVVVKCKPWQPPVGGDNCEQCQEDGKECSAYRCSSLGQTCELINAGTENEKCIAGNKNDVTSPIITVNKEQTVHLTDSIDNIRDINEVKGKGFEITKKIAPFTPVSLSINTNEYAQCKYALENSVKYDEMSQFFGDSDYTMNHTITFSMPGILAENEILSITNGGNYQVFVKCQDGNGNKNEADYYAKFAIEPGPDFTAPVIEITGIDNGAYMPSGINKTGFVMYVNEPSTCRWSDLDEEFESMNNMFACSNSVFPTSSLYYGLYECNTLLTGIEDSRDNNYYFRCEDQPNKPKEDRNVNAESYAFKLKGTGPLSITSVAPDGGIELKHNSPVLKVITAGGAYGNGDSLCGYNFDDPNPKNAIDFLNSNMSVHEQPFFNLTTGDYNIFISCIDDAGNFDNETADFSVIVDTMAPQLSQVYTDPGILHIVTSEPSTCEYSVDSSFNYGTGIPMTGVNVEEHTASIEGDVYYIMCSDTFGNVGSYVLYL
ncbi:MAG: hypothetical protein Q8Q42_01990 [Nanoarchaeota archaeon]|nr:hypothetical protein [Nanoarchaeota archaeon]